MFTQYTLPIVMTIAAVFGNLAVQTDQGTPSASDGKSAQACCLKRAYCCSIEARCCSESVAEQQTLAVAPTAAKLDCCCSNLECCVAQADCCVGGSDCCLVPSDCCFDDSGCCTPASDARSNTSVTAAVVTQLTPTAVDSNDAALICCLKHAYCCSVKAECCRQ